MKRVFSLVALSGIVASASYCSAFGTDGAGGSDGNAGDDASVETAAPSEDGGDPLPGDGGLDAITLDAAAAARKIRCGVGQQDCSLAKGEICCVYGDSLQDTARHYECTLGIAQDCAPSNGDTLLFTTECDDSSDCTDGTICCHTMAGCALPALAMIQHAKCVAASSCPSCAGDGGRIACDPTRTGQCVTNMCDLTTSPVAYGYCK